MIKLKNFSSHKKKAKYTYFLTPSGIYEKTILTAKFLQTKLKEYEECKKLYYEVMKIDSNSMIKMLKSNESSKYYKTCKKIYELVINIEPNNKFAINGLKLLLKKSAVNH